MSGNLYITRAEFALENDGHKIPFNEWQHILDTDMSLSKDPYDEFAVQWKQVTCFWYDDGNIVAHEPDDDVLGQMLRMASRLHASVQGENGDIYQAVGQPPQRRTRAQQSMSATHTAAATLGLRAGHWHGIYRYSPQPPRPELHLFEVPASSLWQKVLLFFMSLRNRPFEMQLQRDGDAVWGDIRDGIGHATLQGTFDADTGHIAFNKRYDHRNSQLDYEGYVHDIWMGGTWSLQQWGLRTAGSWEAVYRDR